MSWGSTGTPLILQLTHLVHVHRVELLIDVEHDRKRHGSLARGKDDDKDRRHLTVQIQRAVVAEGDKIDVRRIKDELDTHQHHNGIPSRQHGVDAKREENGADKEEVNQ